jgi:putative membrane protein
MSHRSHFLTVAAAVVLAGSALAQPPGGNPPDTMGSPPGAPRNNAPNNPASMPQDQQTDPYLADKDFVRNVAESSATEVQLGKLAQDKASNDAVKELGKKMVEAHAQTSQQMKQAATAMNIQVPADPPRKAKKAEEKLSKLSGTDFDRAYTKMAADEQKQFVKDLEREARNGRVAGVKEFAAKNLPAEHERQRQAEELANTGTAARQK